MSPCKDCTKRKLGCHSSCEDYILANKERERIKAAEKAYNSAYWASVRRDKWRG